MALLVKSLSNADVFINKINSYRAGLVLKVLGYNVNKQKLLVFAVANKLDHESIKPIKKTLDLYGSTYSDFFKVVFAYIKYKNAESVLKMNSDLFPDLKEYFAEVVRHQGLVVNVSKDDFMDYALRNVY